MLSLWQSRTAVRISSQDSAHIDAKISSYLSLCTNIGWSTGYTGHVHMHLFHRFLVTVYPDLPLCGDKIRASMIPSFIHNYEYLIHSILALAASHLNPMSHSSLTAQALQHRILALNSLHEALSTPPESAAEQDARIAATMALAFQSSYLDNGMSEFLLMIRGCIIIANNNTTQSLSASLFNVSIPSYKPLKNPYKNAQAQENT
ncbi:predicted protein [Plenodomus lingam JN3]|uniref:Predicted protein n=1 Tax=Leptosphaeria maculans (strain JN3 / isolate v23.1.3 / race Av1-4-5-6-7-8) TaxID=985895 RepID=E5R5G4_LEPMJ|nr:predicted protein [Plenodomus lingam JN3]CBX92134.1 predicted protein [Plenodomus lingam JN3]